MRQLYLAATGQNRGKTTTSLGLFDGFRRRGFRTGFMKPVGQRTIIEGTGHAGVGAVVGLSNAVVAAMLGAPAVIVSGGGVGRPIDEIVLNASHFAAHGVAVAGAIVNKVEVDAQPAIATTLERGLARYGIPLLGILPYRPILSNPSLAMIVEGIPGELIHAGPDLDLVIRAIGIGAMHAAHVLERLRPGTLLIVPGDREELLLTLIDGHVRHRAAGEPPLVSGLILTGGWEPTTKVREAVRNGDLFALLVREDTYPVASAVHDLLVKTHAADREKIELIKELVWDHLAMDRFLEVAKPVPT